jgi:hypothetical protein
MGPCPPMPCSLSARTDGKIRDRLPMRLTVDEQVFGGSSRRSMPTRNTTSSSPESEVEAAHPHRLRLIPRSFAAMSSSRRRNTRSFPPRRRRTRRRSPRSKARRSPGRSRSTNRSSPPVRGTPARTSPVLSASHRRRALRRRQDHHPAHTFRRRSHASRSRVHRREVAEVSSSSRG